MYGQYLLGTSVVLFSTYLYTKPDRSSAEPTRVADFEKTAVGGDSDYYYEDRPSPLVRPHIG